jgi:hypothetical protein
MAFIELADLQKYIYDDVLDGMLEDNDGRVDSAINEGLSEVRSYLSSRYNVEAAFAKTGTARHPMLVRIAKDVVMYHLHSMLETMPALRAKKYDDAREDLNRINRGRVNLDGEQLVVPENSTGLDVGYGGNLPRGNYF